MKMEHFAENKKRNVETFLTEPVDFTDINNEYLVDIRKELSDYTAPSHLADKSYQDYAITGVMERLNAECIYANYYEFYDNGIDYIGSEEHAIVEFLEISKHINRVLIEGLLEEVDKELSKRGIVVAEG